MPANKEKSNELRKQIYEYYKRFKTVAFTADRLGCSPTTVQKYFTEFADIELRKTDECFLKEQRITKARILYKLDELIDKAEMQLEVLESKIGYNEEGIGEGIETPDETRIAQLVNKIHGDLIVWNQQKAAIEDSPTLDVKIGQLLEDRVHELDERENKLNELEQKLINKKRK